MTKKILNILFFIYVLSGCSSGSSSSSPKSTGSCLNESESILNVSESKVDE